jgi:hypothetical protein
MQVVVIGTNVALWLYAVSRIDRVAEALASVTDRLTRLEVRMTRVESALTALTGRMADL